MTPMPLRCLTALFFVFTALSVVGETFKDHVRPILNRHCTKCHGGVKQAGGVSFVYEKSVLGKGKSGDTIVVPGKPEESALYKRISTSDEDDRMPPADEHPEPLPSHEIESIRKWIEAGAPWDNHWSFEAIQNPALPAVSNKDWPRQKLDHFVLNKMTEKGLSPASDANPERWLRRASLDLIGLPPTMDELDSFLTSVKADGEKAYKNEVDRLLSSPHYGERWASMWMDQIRYADSKGLGLDGKRSIWKYRDWLIDAFNEDLPYDQFTIKQLAGDLLPDPSMEDLIATAAHRNTQANNEGGTDDEEFRMMAVLDRVNTTWQVWQATTFGCVQCHNHPYDPYTNEEYYKFTDFFNNTTDADTQQDHPLLRVPLDKKDYPKAAKLHHKIRSLEEEIWSPGYALLKNNTNWKGLKEIKAKTSNHTKLVVEETLTHDEFRTVGTIQQKAVFTIDAPLPDDQKKLTAIRLTGMPQDLETALKDAEWGWVVTGLQFHLITPGENSKPQELKIAQAVADEPHPLYDPMESFKKGNRGFAAYTKINHPRQAAFILETPVELPENASLRVTMKHDLFILASFSLVTQRGHIATSGSEDWQAFLKDESILAKRSELAKARSAHNAIKSVSTPYMTERHDSLTRPSHMFVRGNFLEKDRPVTADVPDALRSSGERPDDRLSMAKWLVSGKNPLTARVAANRIWEQLFGKGIVVTLEDFGSSGASPTHPLLLDHLASRFQKNHQWSQKKLLREIVLSSTYRQSSVISPEKLANDPSNQWLSRAPRFRLSAEAIRDQALAVSGLLSRKLHGEPVRPPIPDGVWKPFSKDPWKAATGEDRFRRALYVYIKRSIPYPSFASFDAPSREFCSPRRLSSNTPLQALVTLNDTAFMECSEALAKRMASHSDDLDDQLAFGYRLATCERPDEERTNALKKLYQETQSLIQDEAKAKELALINVASVLLNLGEVLTR